MFIMSYPEKLPKPIRRNNSVLFSVVVFVAYCCFSILGLLVLDCGIDLLCLLSLLLILCWIPVRVLRFLIEFAVWRSMYKEFNSLFQRSFKMYHWRSFVAFLLLKITLIYLTKDERGISSSMTEKHFSLQDMLIIFPIVITLGLYFEWDNSPLLESYRVEQPFSFSGGSGMAFGYFYGYLKIINTGIVDILNRYQARNQIKDKDIPEKKLFILIPSSSKVVNKQLRTGRETIEAIDDMFESCEQDRGLNLKRVYKNTLYKIKSKKDNNKTKYYVLFEGASPLRTFYDVYKYHNDFEEYKQEVVSSFYYTLENLLRADTDIKDLVELVYFNDEVDPDIDIGDVIRQRIRYLKKSRIRKENKLKNC